MEKCRQEIFEDNVYQDFLENTINYPFLEVIRANSAEVAIIFLNNSIILIFIDGDHSFDAV